MKYSKFCTIYLYISTVFFAKMTNLDKMDYWAQIRKGQQMHDILLIGGGKIGEMIAHMLRHTGDYHVTVVDHDAALLEAYKQQNGVTPLLMDAGDEDALVKVMAGKYAVVTACPYTINQVIARAAHRAGVHYFDLTEDVHSTKLVQELAKTSKAAFVPQCGLAPGFISIVAYDLAKRFDSLHKVHMRVGALPQFPTNAMKYNLTWSTDGLINEFSNPCEAIVAGRLTTVPPLEEVEQFTLDGIQYEAFNTSGGLGTLADTLAGKVDYLNYRTVRYPGHRDLLKLLLQDLRLGERREICKDIFEYALPSTEQDVVLIFVTVTGEKNGRFSQESFAQKVYARPVYGRDATAIQITTASGICAMVDLMREGKLPQKGFVRQEDTNFKDFIDNRFGANYAESHKVSAH